MSLLLFSPFLRPRVGNEPHRIYNVFVVLWIDKLLLPDAHLPIFFIHILRKLMNYETPFPQGRVRIHTNGNLREKEGRKDERVRTYGFIRSLKSKKIVVIIDISPLSSPDAPSP